MFAVVVTFQIQPEAMPAMLDNASTSLAQEADCHQFDVCTDPDRVNEVFLYEIYTNRAAFDIHLESAHFRAFDTLVAPMIAGKTITTYAQVTS